jgi:hypothetical protein
MIKKFRSGKNPFLSSPYLFKQPFYRTKVLLLIGATDKGLRADGNIYAGAIPGCFIIELLAQLAHQLAP